MNQNLNNFSLISRLFGNLFYRDPSDPILAGVFGWLQQQGLSQVWALDTNSQSQQALANLQAKIEPSALSAEYQKLFGENGKVAIQLSAYELDPQAFLVFRQARSMPAVENPDHFALLLLSASWIEDNLDSLQAQHQLFEEFLLPCASKFLNQVESQASLPFYRSLALLCREMLSAMADELEESDSE